MTVQIGSIVPDFTLPGSNGKKVSLSAFRGKKIILYFYPKDMTPGCTTEACDFRDYFSRLSDLGVVVLGVSADPIDSHEKFINKYELPFLLLSDEELQVAKLFDVWKLKKNFGREYMGIERSTFLIDEDGMLVQEWRNVKVVGHAAAVYSTILLGDRK